MAFNGNLHEFGIVALLQLPNTNRLTGRLLVQGRGKEAEFFYQKGKLIHAASGGVRGKDVLAVVIDWDEGKFSFESETESTAETIREDLHHSLMWALKERDERKKKEEEMRQVEEERRRLETLQKAQEAAAEPEPEIEPEMIPREFLESASHANYTCILNGNGVIVAETDAENEFKFGIGGYMSAVRSFVKNYPGKSVGKTFIDDPEFSLGMSGNGRGYTVVIIASPQTRLGTLSMELVKFMGKLEGQGFGESNEGPAE